jgi:hypothetical protein
MISILEPGFHARTTKQFIYHQNGFHPLYLYQPLHPPRSDLLEDIATPNIS